jgi:hypothetical protein
MAEFTSEFKSTQRSKAPYIMIAVAVVIVVAVAVVWHYQKTHPAAPAGGPIVVPGMVRPGEPAFEAYKNKVRIENVKATIGLNFAGTRSAFIDGIISNEGDRKLEAVEFHITLYDVYDKVSKEKTVLALRPGVGFNRNPMDPLEKRTFTVSIEPVEQLWNPKRVEIEISGLKYK